MVPEPRSTFSVALAELPTPTSCSFHGSGRLHSIRVGVGAAGYFSGVWKTLYVACRRVTREPVSSVLVTQPNDESGRRQQPPHHRFEKLNGGSYRKPLDLVGISRICSRSFPEKVLMDYPELSAQSRRSPPSSSLEVSGVVFSLKR